MALFTFELDTFQITETRSLHLDTDYVTLTLSVNPGGAMGNRQSLTKSMGDLNNGTFPVFLQFSNISVNPTDTVSLNYLIVNTGNKDPGKVHTTIENVAKALLEEALKDVTGIFGKLPGLSSVVSKVSDWISQGLFGILFANCDGTVAAEQNTFTYNDLIMKTANGPFKQSTKHPGTDSPRGCGANSVYFVNWHMLQVGNAANKTVPSVFEMSVANAQKAVQNAGLVAHFSGPNTPKSWVNSQSPGAGQVVTAGTTVSMVLIEGPLK